MKKKKFLAFILSLCIIGGYAPVYNIKDYTITASAEESVTDGYLTFTVYDDYAEVAKCDESAEGEVIIPSEINGVPVTIIGYWAFENCSKLTSITISENVTDICLGAFSNCSSLKSITIPNNVTSIGDRAFESTSFESITIPNSVTTIGGWTFSNCQNLESIVIPESVTNIDDGAFCDCSSLTSITILNPNCQIVEISDTICNGNGYFNGTIYGYDGSTAQAYAETYGYKFAVIQDDDTTETVAGDSNGDGQVTLADAVAILQYVANSDKYSLSEQGLANADCYNTGDGITGMDALAIQMYDFGQIESLPLNN